MDASAVVPIVIAASIGVVGWLVRQLDSARTKRVEEKLAEHTTAIASLTAANLALADRLRLDELETVRLQGRVALTEANHGGLERDLDEIKSSLREMQRSMSALVAAVGTRGAPPASAGSSPRVPAVRDR